MRFQSPGEFNRDACISSAVSAIRRIGCVNPRQRSWNAGGVLQSLLPQSLQTTRNLATLKALRVSQQVVQELSHRRFSSKIHAHKCI